MFFKKEGGGGVASKATVELKIFKNLGIGID